MVNLISPTLRARLMSLYYARLVTACALAIAVALSVTAILLLPTYFFIHAEADQAQEYVEAASGIAATRAKGAAQETLASFNEAVKLLTAVNHEPSVSHMLTLLTSDMPRGVTLSTIDIVSDTSGNATVLLSGTARTRAELIAYSATLKKIPEFSNVSVPVSALVADVNSTFSVTMTWVRPQKP